MLTANEDADGSGRLPGSERRVRSTRILRLVRRYHRMQNERAVSVDLGVLHCLEVEHSTVLGPDDDRARWIGLDWAVNATDQTSR